MSRPGPVLPVRESAALAGLPRYPFVALEARIAERRRAGLPVLNFGIGDPDLGPAPALREAARRAVLSDETHRYSTSAGEPELREAIARWVRVRFGVSLDPAEEVVVLSGSKEGLAQFPRAILDAGSRVLVPDPGYPVYRAAAVLAGTRPVTLPLIEREDWRPDWEAAPAAARLCYLNYPNNPTGAVLGVDGLREAAERARDGRFLVAYDNAYSEVTFGGFRAPSLLEVPGGREVGVEFHSFSKTFGVPGWRLGFAIGNAEALRALVKLKSQGDSGVSLPMQRAAIEALGWYQGAERPRTVEASVREYGERLRRLVDGLTGLGMSATLPGGGLYLWQRAPGGSGEGFATRLLAEHGIVVAPGGGFGDAGRAYVRWSVTRPSDEIDRAISLMASGAGTPGPARSGARARTAAPRRAASAPLRRTG